MASSAARHGGEGVDVGRVGSTQWATAVNAQFADTEIIYEEVHDVWFLLLSVGGGCNRYAEQSGDRCQCKTHSSIPIHGLFS